MAQLPQADVVGSLLRPPELLAAREALAAGTMTPADFKRVEDSAVDAAVALQEEAGLEIVTDGEMRRLSFQSQMLDAVEGFQGAGLDAFLWGDWRGDERVGAARRERPEQLAVTSTLRRKRHLAAEEFTYLRARAGRLPKVTLPSPSLYASFWSPDQANAYSSIDAFLSDAAAILRDEVAELVRLGAAYVQLDAPHYALVLDPFWAAFYESRGWNAAGWLARGVELDNAVMEGFGGVTFALHLCRGNQGSRWLAEGGYEPLVKPVLQRTSAQRLMLEYDDERSGGFEALRGVPDDKTVVLGLVTTKGPRVETTAGLAERVREAARCFPLEQLAISPQCGFATSIEGNALTPDDQRRKLRAVSQTAQAVWG